MHRTHQTAVRLGPGKLAGRVTILGGGESGVSGTTGLELAAAGAPLKRSRVTFGRKAEVDALVDQVLERHGQTDLLVNNAGGQCLIPAEDITPRGFRAVIRIKVEGPWLMSHAVIARAVTPRAGAR